MKKYSLASDIFHDDDESVEDNDSYIYTFNPEGYYKYEYIFRNHRI